MTTAPGHRRSSAAACAAILLLLPAGRARCGGVGRIAALTAIPSAPRGPLPAAAAGLATLPPSGIPAAVSVAASAAQEAPRPAPAVDGIADEASGVSALRAAAAPSSGVDGSGPVFDGKSSAAEAVSETPLPADAVELRNSLRALQLVPTSPADLRAGLIRHLQIIGEGLRSGAWPSLRAESEGKMSLLVGMLEYLRKALAKDVALCKKCVSNRSCSKVEGGKGCSGCLASVKMSAEEVESALRAAAAISAHLKSPTIEGVNGFIAELRSAR